MRKMIMSNDDPGDEMRSFKYKHHHFLTDDIFESHIPLDLYCAKCPDSLNAIDPTTVDAMVERSLKDQKEILKNIHRLLNEFLDHSLTCKSIDKQ
jgi:hypothetical protein